MDMGNLPSSSLNQINQIFSPAIIFSSSEALDPTSVVSSCLYLSRTFFKQALSCSLFIFIKSALPFSVIFISISYRTTDLAPVPFLLFSIVYLMKSHTSSSSSDRIAWRSLSQSAGSSVSQAQVMWILVLRSIWQRWVCLNLMILMNSVSLSLNLTSFSPASVMTGSQAFISNLTYFPSTNKLTCLLINLFLKASTHPSLPSSQINFSSQAFKSNSHFSVILGKSAFPSICSCSILRQFLTILSYSSLGEPATELYCFELGSPLRDMTLPFDSATN